MAPTHLIHQAAAWERYFNLLDERRCQHREESAWDAHKYVCKKLSEESAANLSILASDGRHINQQVANEIGEVDCMVQVFRKYVTVNVVKMSGEILLQDVRLFSVDHLSCLRELANTQLHKDAIHDANEVSALISSQGVPLCDSMTFEGSGLTHGSTVTAVVTTIDELGVIEGLFRALMENYSYSFSTSKITGLPSLKDYSHTIGHGETEFFETSFMYGGFVTTLSKDETAKPGSQWELYCKFWNAICEGYGDAHKITRKHGIVLANEEMVY